MAASRHWLGERRGTRRLVKRHAALGTRGRFRQNRPRCRCRLL